MTGYPSTTSPTVPAASTRSNTCAWCGTVTDGTALSCPSCGASMDVRNTITQSGWTEVPGRHDMARIQFGKSSAQIEGAYVPVIDVDLAAQDSVYFPHHVLLWKEPQTKVTTLPLKGAWKRMMAGMPVIMTQAQGPGRVAFSRDAPGEMMALPIQPGHSVDVREHIFVLASGTVVYDWFQTNVWFTTKSGDESETHYPLGMYMDRFLAQKNPGVGVRARGGQRVRAHARPWRDHPGQAHGDFIQGLQRADATAHGNAEEHLQPVRLLVAALYVAERGRAGAGGGAVGL